LYVCHGRNFFEISYLSAEPNDGTNTLPRSFNFEDNFFETAPPESSFRPAYDQNLCRLRRVNYIEDSAADNETVLALLVTIATQTLYYVKLILLINSADKLFVFGIIKQVRIVVVGLTSHDHVQCY